MSGTRSGVLAAGNWIVDRVKRIDHYPEESALAYILDESIGNGGSPYNVLKDLARMGADFPLAGAGRLGDDALADYITDDCRAHGIDVMHLTRTPGEATSHTDVMMVRSTGKRTFFHMPGANRLLDLDDLPLRESRAKIFHLGYLLLLERLDRVGADDLTGAARAFREALALGFRTSADVVSEESDRFAHVVNPALPFIDFFFCNEQEARKITGIATTRGAAADWDGMARAARVLIDRGVRELVCIHHPDGAVACTNSGRELRQPSVALPADKVEGSVGSGDAFAAGVLYAVHEDRDLVDSLRLGVCAAACCLFDATTSQGVEPWQECLRVGATYGFRD